MAATQNAGHFHVGDWVTFRFGARKPVAQIAEDRGELGANGQKIYRVRLFRESDSFEVREDQLERAAPKGAEAVEYLKNGALLEVLQSHGGSTAWLIYDPVGQVRHTFDPLIGTGTGATVPINAVLNSKIFIGLKDDVQEFLTRLGLTPDEAGWMVHSIGTASP